MPVRPQPKSAITSDPKFAKQARDPKASKGVREPKQAPEPREARAAQELLEPDEHAVHAAPKHRGRRGFETQLLIVLGLVATVGGAALTAASKLSWKLGQLAEGIRSTGIEGGTLMMGGAVLLALALLRRAQLAEKASEADDSLLMEQLAADMILLRNALDGIGQGSGVVSRELRAVQAQINVLAQAQQAQQAQQAEPQPQNGPGEEAIFRLAASLDQLGARMEQRLKSQYDSMQDSLEELNGVVVSVRKNLQEMFDAAQATPAPLGITRPSSPGGYGAPSAPPSSTQVTAGQMIEHDAPYAPPIPAPEPHIALEPRGPQSSLGVLDSLDDPRSAPALSPPSLARTSMSPRLGSSAIRPVPQMPSAALRPAPATDDDTWAELVQLDPPSEHAQSSEPETQQKLDQLNSLLADERLRAALDKMRRGA